MITGEGSHMMQLEDEAIEAHQKTQIYETGLGENSMKRGMPAMRSNMRIFDENECEKI